MSSRLDVLVRLIERYEKELATAWVDAMPVHRMRALIESLESARKELRDLCRERHFGPPPGWGSGADQAPVPAPPGASSEVVCPACGARECECAFHAPR
jgi:hypothetical protein